MTAAGRDAWDRSWVGWDTAFAVGIAVVVAGAAVELDGARLAAVVTLVLALAAWYAAVGARALRTGSGRAAAAYLLGMGLLFVPTFGLYGFAGVLYFVLYPQVWMMTYPARRSIQATVLLTVAGAAATLLGRDLWPPAVLAGAAVQLVFAVTMGLWISAIVRQSIERRTVIAELEETRAELAAVSHRAGELAERERLAREIHDTLAQGFTSVLMLLELADSEVTGNPAAARRRLAAARETARQNLAEARSLVASHTPADLEAAPLPEALGRLVDRFGRETGRPARFAVAGEPRSLPPNQEIVLLRAAQESLANVRKHAGACEVGVDLRYSPGGAALTVADDGGGFDPATAPAGYGLAGLRRRADEVGGTVDVRSGPRGTTVEVRCSG